MESEAKRVVRWENMNAEILGLIFTKVSGSSDEVVRSACLVCKWWSEVVVGPYCWAEIDLERWCFTGDKRDIVDSVVMKLVQRSHCTATRLYVYHLGNPGFASVATCGRFLTALQIPVSEITDDMVEKHVWALVNLKELDLSCCSRITWKGLSYFGKSCPALTSLKRNQFPRFLSYDEKEAYAIAKTMTGLCRLELSNGSLGDNGLNAILTNCKSLTHLDIEGCDNVSLDGELVKQCERLSVFKCRSIWYSQDYVESDTDEVSSYSI